MTRSLTLLVGTALALGACDSHAAMTTATPDTLARTLDRARAGDTIRLAPGSYARFEIKDKQWKPAITVEADAATMQRVALSKVSGLVWRGGTFDGEDTINTAIAAAFSDNITIDGTKLRRYRRNGIIVDRSSDIRLLNNAMTGMGSDGIQIALSRQIVIDRNSCSDFVVTPKAHPDCIQLWSRPTAAPVADVKITNNSIVGHMQGIGMFNHVRGGVDDGGFDRVTITGNDIRITFPNGIYTDECRDCVIRNNRIDGFGGSKYKAKLFYKGGSVSACGNVAPMTRGGPGQERCG